MMERPEARSVCVWTLSGFLAVFFVLEIILNLTPPISRDALIHHLAIPKLWLRHSGFVETPWADYSYYPMNIDLLYLAALGLGGEVLCKFIHMGFGVGTGLLLYLYLTRLYGRCWGLLGATIFLTTPIVVWLATSAYIDLGMTFFTTAALLGFLRWRDSGYRRTGLLLLAGVSMGLGVGSKYNALLAWLILNLLIVRIFVRETGRQKAAVGYGGLFFLMAALVASPWYVKNFLLTGNPVYPMFKSFFFHLDHQPVAGALLQQAEEKVGRLGFFQMRKVLYGESFLETLLIPLRMFFQGQDNSYRYFQGVLNPILIVFLPFSFLDRDRRTPRGLFIGFAALYIACAYFLTEKQVRYLLPTLPFLAVVAVMGVRELTVRFASPSDPDTRAPREAFRIAARAALPVVVGGLLVLNGVYLVKRFNKIDPMPYVMGHESRDAFLSRSLAHYPAVVYINSHLPKDARLFIMFLGRRAYYLDRDYRNEAAFGGAALSTLVERSGEPAAFAAAVRTLGATHLFIRMDLFSRHLEINYSPEEIRAFWKQFRQHGRLLREINGYAVWEIRPSTFPENDRNRDSTCERKDDRTHVQEPESGGGDAGLQCGPDASENLGRGDGPGGRRPGDRGGRQQSRRDRGDRKDAAGHHRTPA